MLDKKELGFCFEKVISIAFAQNNVENLFPKSCQSALRLCNKRLKQIIDSGRVDVKIRLHDHLGHYVGSDLAMNTVNLDLETMEFSDSGDFSLLLEAPFPNLESLKVGRMDYTEPSQVPWPQIRTMYLIGLQSTVVPAWLGQASNCYQCRSG